MISQAKASFIIPLAIVLSFCIAVAAAITMVDLIRDQHGAGTSNASSPSYEISIGYHDNMKDGRLTNAGTVFGEKNGLIAQIHLPEAAKANVPAVFTIVVTKTNQVVMREQLQINSGEDSRSIKLHAEQWEMGEYHCTFAMNGVVVASKTLYFQ